MVTEKEAYENWVSTEDGFCFQRISDRRRAVRDAEMFIRIISDLAGEHPSDKTLDLEHPFDGRKHTLTDGVSFICEEAPSPDQDHVYQRKTIPWTPLYDSFRIIFSIEGGDPRELYYNVWHKYIEHKASVPLSERRASDYT
jgi:hypothetical protein